MAKVVNRGIVIAIEVSNAFQTPEGQKLVADFNQFAEEFYRKSGDEVHAYSKNHSSFYLSTGGTTRISLGHSPQEVVENLRQMAHEA